MKVRPAHETLESLRVALLKVEQTAEPDHDREALADLKRILLQRIAELEAVQALEVQALESASSPTEDKPSPADLVPPASVRVDDSSDIAVDAVPSTPPAEPDAC